MKRGAGYIAIDRGIFDHWIARNAKRFRAWQWMIAEAAHVPMGKRGSWGVVHVERGEFAASLAILAVKWRWTRSSVYRFLKRLENEGMVRLRETRRKTETATETATAPYLDHEISIITICHYDQFQNSSTAAKLRAEHQPKQQPNFDPAQTHMFPGFCEPLTTEPLNQKTNRVGVGGEGEEKASDGEPPKPRVEAGPRHGMTSTKHGTIYLKRGTEDWRVHAEDYRTVMGAEPLPDRFGGFWFCIRGEAVRPANQRTWRNANAFGAAKFQGGRR